MTSDIPSITTESTTYAGNEVNYAKIGTVIIQWGTLDVPSGVLTEYTVTLATAFSNTNYKVATTNWYAQVTSGDATLPRIGTCTKTSFKVMWDCYNMNAVPSRYLSYIAVGT